MNTEKVRKSNLVVIQNIFQSIIERSQSYPNIIHDNIIFTRGLGIIEENFLYLALRPRTTNKDIKRVIQLTWSALHQTWLFHFTQILLYPNSPSLVN